MKHRLKHIATVFAACLSAVCTGGEPLSWTRTPANPNPAAFSTYHGQTLDLFCRFEGFGELPFAESGVNLYWQTNGMGGAWWSMPATVNSNTVSASWLPGHDPGAGRVTFFFGAQSNAYASAVVRLLPSPGFVPVVQPLPDVAFDAALVGSIVTNIAKEIMNAAASPPLRELVPDITDATVTLAPVDGAANWVDGRVERVNDVSTMSYAVRGGMYIEVYSEPDYEGDIIEEEFVYFDAPKGTIKLDDIYCIEEGYVYELRFIVLEDLELRYVDFDSGRVVGYVPKGARLFATVFEGDWGENLEGRFTCATMVDDAVFTGFEEGGSVNYGETDDGGALIQDVTVDLGRRVTVTLPTSADAAKARWFSLALETDADSEKEVTWQGGEVIEALPGASKLVPGLNVWDVAEVAPGKFKVERASSPAQSVPLTLTSPNGRTAQLAVDDDLVLNVKEITE